MIPNLLDGMGVGTMREQILRFMQDCPEAKTQVFANNAFGVFVRNDIPEALYASVKA